MQYIFNGCFDLFFGIWKKWVFVCGMGEFLGIIVVVVIVIVYCLLLGELVSNFDCMFNLFFMLMVGVLEGSIFVYFQYCFIGKIFLEIVWKQWLVYIIVVVVIVWMLGMLFFFFFIGNGVIDFGMELFFFVYYSMVVLMGLLFGVLFGYFQWLLLKGLCKEVMFWIFVNFFGWVVGMVFIFLGVSWLNVNIGWLFILLVGVLGGIVGGFSVGVIMGFFLFWIVCFVF